MRSILIFIFACFIGGPSAPAVQCFKDHALEVRKEIFSSTDDIRSLGAALAGDESFVFLKEAADDPGFGQWYIYTNDKKYQGKYQAASGQDISTGIIEQMKTHQSTGFLEHYSDFEMGALDLFERAISPRVAIIQGDIPAPYKYLSKSYNPPLIVKVPTKGLSASGQKITDLISASPQDVLVIHLLPESIEDAKVWNLQSQRTRDFVAVGKRISSDLETYGASISHVRNSESFKSVLTKSSNKHVIIVGESPDGGKSVLIPGTNERLYSHDIPTDAPFLSIHGLFCDSSNFLPKDRGVSVLGTLYTSQTRDVLQLVLDKRKADDSIEYLLFSASNENWLLSILTNIGAGSLLLLADDDEKNKELSNRPNGLNAKPSAVVVSEGLLTSFGLEHSHRKNTLHLYLAGCLGAVLRELLRWKKIFAQRRKRAFYRAPYIAVSLILVILAGFVGVIFARPDFGDFQLPLAFVCGAGLELIVSLAAKLNIWTPSVSQGADTQQQPPPTVNEFLRF